MPWFDSWSRASMLQNLSPYGFSTVRAFVILVPYITAEILSFPEGSHIPTFNCHISGIESLNKFQSVRDSRLL